MSAIIYARVSTNTQFTKGSSIPAQINICTEFADECDFKIAEIITRNGDGHKNDLDVLFRNKTKNIIIYDVSRFSRNVERGIYFINKAMKRDKVIHFIHEKITLFKDNIHYQNNYKKFVKALEKAEAESIELGRRISAAKAYMKKKGIYCGGRISYGLELYNINIINEIGQKQDVKKYKINEREYNVIKFILKCYSFNYTSQELTNLMRNISTYTNDAISLWHQEGEWEEESDKNTEPLSSSDIASLLNVFEVYYRNGKNFTPTIVRNIFINRDKLKSYIASEPSKTPRTPRTPRTPISGDSVNELTMRLRNTTLRW